MASKTHTDNVEEPSLGSVLLAQQRQGEFCDFTIECSDGSVRVHRCVVAAASDFFKAMMSSSMKEATTQIVRLEYTSVALLQAIITFMYIGQIDIHGDDVVEVFKVALVLQVTKLVAECCRRFEAAVTNENVMRLHGLSGDFYAPGLCEVVCAHLSSNFASLISNEAFLVGADVGLMERLMKSDHLVMPNEDSVLDLLMAWLDKDQTARAAYAGPLSTLIRFPFLRASRIACFERLAGPVQALLSIEDADTWDLEQPIFKQRRYNSVHCHLGWSNRTAGVDRTHFVTCGDLMDHHETVIEHGGLDVPLRWGLVVRGHSAYFRVADLRRGGRQRDADRDRHIKAFTINSSGDVYFVFSLHGEYRIQVVSANGRSRTINLEEGFLIELEEVSSIEVYKKLIILAGLDLVILDLESEQAEGPVETASHEVRTDLDRMTSVATAIRGDTLFICFQYRHSSRRRLIRSFHLNTREWSDVRIDDSRDSSHLFGPRLMVLRGEIYVTGLCIPPDGQNTLSVRKLDEQRGELVHVVDLSTPDRYLMGRLPLDFGASCHRETWLSAQCRGLPDDSKLALATLHRLRQIAH